MYNLFSLTININILSINKWTLVLFKGRDVGYPKLLTHVVCGGR